MTHDWPRQLTEWFAAHRRTMPWRDQPIPYYVWLSEIMLQQTQVKTVEPYFQRFIEQFPTVHDLASAPEDAVMKSWEGLGYYRRARNLHKAAKIVSNEMEGKFPSSYEDLKSLPGLGFYTAAAVASIAFGKQIPAVDGNVCRVMARFHGIESDIKDPRTRNRVFADLEDVLQQVDASLFNQALMELGALICRPKAPDCGRCPISSHCYAFSASKVDRLPVVSKRNPTPHQTITVGLIRSSGRILLQKRPNDKMLGGLWVFPGGPQYEGESIEQALEREVRENTNLRLTTSNEICRVSHAYTHLRITLIAFDVSISSEADLKERSARELIWADENSIRDFALPKVDLKVLDTIKSGSIQPTLNLGSEG